MDVTSTTSVQKTTSSDIVSNPGAKLDKDAFMKLFLTELQYQDPTKPMDDEKMMQQTAQLSQMETNQNLQNTLNQLMSQMKVNNQFSTVSMIGKIADTGNDGFAINDPDNMQDVPFDLYFGSDYLSATVKITDSNGNVVRSFDLGEGNAGIQSFSWDGTDDNGNKVSKGVYAITAEYKDKNTLEIKNTKMGLYPISAVKFDNGSTLVKLDNNYVDLSKIKEVRDSL